MDYFKIFKAYAYFLFPNKAIDISILSVIPKGPEAINTFMTENFVVYQSSIFNGICCLIVIHNLIRNDHMGNDYETTFTDDHMQLCLHHLGIFESHGDKMTPLKEILERFANTTANRFHTERYERYSFI